MRTGAMSTNLGTLNILVRSTAIFRELSNDQLTPIWSKADLVQGERLTSSGLMRRDERQRRRRVEPPVVERAPGDRTGKLARARLQQLLHIVDRRQSAGGDHRDVDRIRQRDAGIEVKAL